MITQKRLVVLALVFTTLLVAICGWRLTVRFEGLKLSGTRRAEIDALVSSFDGASAGSIDTEVQGVDGGWIVLFLPEEPKEASPGKVVMANGTTILVSCRTGDGSRWYQNTRSEVHARPLSLWELLTIGDEQYEQRIHFLREKCSNRFNDRSPEVFNNLTGLGIIRTSGTDGQTEVVYYEDNQGDDALHEVSIVVVGAADDGEAIARDIASGISIAYARRTQ